VSDLPSGLMLGSLNQETCLDMHCALQVGTRPRQDAME
jgi:hypothetical protein